MAWRCASVFRNTLLVLVIAGISVGCNPAAPTKSAAEIAKDEAKAKLLGKWKEVGKREVMEFFSDGRMAVTGTIPAAGSWAVLDDGRIKAEISALGMTLVGMITVDEKGILTVDQDGSKSRYARYDGTKKAKKRSDQG